MGLHIDLSCCRRVEVLKSDSVSGTAYFWDAKTKPKSENICLSLGVVFLCRTNSDKNFWLINASQFSGYHPINHRLKTWHKWIKYIKPVPSLLFLVMSRSLTNPIKWHVCQAKTRISLGFHPVWSESSPCAQRVAQDPRFLHADSEDSD